MTRRDMRVERADGAAVVALIGEHDAFTAERLRHTLDELLDEPAAIVIDFSEATFVDSTTVAALLNARRRALDAGVALALAVPPSAGEHLRRLFDMTQLDAIFSIHASREAALASLRPQD
jgi:anti-sigma B factor antagonist